jgi:O-antigen ligase
LRSLATFANEVRWLLLIILVLRGVFFVVRGANAGPDPTRAPRRIMIGMGLLALASTGWSGNPAFTLNLAISFCLGLFVTFGLVWRLADDASVIESIARGAVLFAGLVFDGGFVVAWVAYITQSWDVFAATKLEWGGRYSGVFINPNAAGMIGAMLLPIIVAAPREFLGGVAWMRVPVFLVTFATIFLSGSRSALIGSAMAILILAVYRFGGGALITIALGGVAVWALAVYAPMDDIDASAVGHIARTKHLSTLSGRMELWEQGWDAAQDRLALGHGWGESRALGNNVNLERAIEMGQVVGATNLHNAHLQLLIDLGFAGVSLFWIFILHVLRSGLQILLVPRSPRNGLALVIFTSALALIADTWVHGAIWSMGSPTTLAFWAVCVLSLREGARARRDAALDARGVPALAGEPFPASARGA